jgi:hypothetical protein
MKTYEYPNFKGFVFIVTYGRSGSTLLQRIIQSIPNSEIYGENFNCLEASYRAYRRAFKSRYDFGKQLQPPSHPWHGANGINPDRYARKLAQIFIEEILQPSINVSWLGFKEIRYNLLGDEFDAYLDFIRLNFPNTQFIFNMRNSEEVMKSGWWVNSPKEKVLAIVDNMDSKFNSYASANPEISFLTRHEKTRDDPTYLKELFERIGETYDAQKIASIMAQRLNH